MLTLAPDLGVSEKDGFARFLIFRLQSVLAFPNRENQANLCAARGDWLRAYLGD